MPEEILAAVQYIDVSEVTFAHIRSREKPEGLSQFLGRDYSLLVRDELFLIYEDAVSFADVESKFEADLASIKAIYSNGLGEEFQHLFDLQKDLFDAVKDLEDNFV